MVRYEFDPVKDRSNLRKHGVSLTLAEHLDWDAALAWRDDRFEYGEIRYRALVPSGGNLFFVAFAERGTTWRIISLRRANQREVRHYVSRI
jgi:uncharacterized protein